METASHLTYSGDLSVATVIVCDMGTCKVGNVKFKSTFKIIIDVEPPWQKEKAPNSTSQQSLGSYSDKLHVNPLRLTCRELFLESLFWMNTMVLLFRGFRARIKNPYHEVINYGLRKEMKRPA